MTRISLLATAMALPALIAASAGARPAVPTMEMRTRSASAAWRVHQTLRTAMTRRAGRELAAHGVDPRRFIKCHGTGFELGGLGKKRRGGPTGGETDDFHAVGDVPGGP